MSYETARAETIRGQYYQVCQQFKTHTDYFEPNSAFTPVVSRAVIWNSVLLNGEVNPATAHCGKPVLTGEKFVIIRSFITHGKLKYIY